MDIELSKQAFHEAWKHFDLGSKPIVLNVLPQGVLESERRAAEATAWDELRRLGFGDRDREDDLYEAFLPLQRYERAFDIIYRERVPDGQRVVSGMVAGIRDHATLAVHQEETVRLTTLRANSMIRALLSILPEVREGRGRAVSLRSKQLESAASQARSSDRVMADGLTRQGVRREDARALVEMAGGERVAFAQIGASIMDDRGKRTRASMVTNCFATANGWYLLEETRRSGEPWTTIAPIDKQRMGSRVQDLLKAVMPR